MRKGLLLVVMTLISTTLVGCKPYQKPIFETIETNESAVLVPLVGDTEDQDQTLSEQYYLDNMVYTKRVEIPTQWVQTGRMKNSGKWMPTMKLIKVSRTPESREWTSAEGTGTSNRNESFTVMTKDGQNYTVGIVISASVKEESVAKFLYHYAGRQLGGKIIVDENGNKNAEDSIIDGEIRTAVQAALSDVAGQYNAEMTIESLGSIVTSLKEDVIQHFAAKGITIDSIGFEGGITFENPEIQSALDAIIQASLEKAEAVIRREIEEAEAQHQTTLQEQLRLQAEAEAATKLAIAQGEAAVIEEMAKAEAAAKLAVQNIFNDTIDKMYLAQFIGEDGNIDTATKDAFESTTYQETDVKPYMTRLEVAKQYVAYVANMQWDGELPDTILSGDGQVIIGVK